MLEQVTSYNFINGELPLTCPLAIQAFQLGQQMNTVMLDSYVNDFAHVVSSSSDISKKGLWWGAKSMLAITCVEKPCRAIQEVVPAS